MEFTLKAFAGFFLKEISSKMNEKTRLTSHSSCLLSYSEGGKKHKLYFMPRI